MPLFCAGVKYRCMGYGYRRFLLEISRFEGAHGVAAPAAPNPPGARRARSGRISRERNKHGDELDSTRASRNSKVRLATPTRRLTMDPG
eukprot:4324665-Pleurochrysis_carterae.AAC.1